MKRAEKLVAIVLVGMALATHRGFGQDETPINDNTLAQMIVAGKWPEIAKLKGHDAVSQFAVTTACGVTQDWDRMDREAPKTNEYKDSDERINGFLEELKNSQPANSNVHFITGVFYQTNDPDRALREYAKAVSIDPRFAAAYFNIASIYHGRNDMENRLTNLQKAIEADPDFLPAYRNMAAAYTKLEKYQEAVKRYEQCEHLLERRKGRKDSMVSDTYYRWGWIYVNTPLKDNKKAIQLLTTAIEADPDLPDAYNSLGIAYKREAEARHRSNDINGMKEIFATKAIPCFKKAIELNPKDAIAHFNLGVAYNNIGNINDAKPHFKKTAELDPGSRLGIRAKQLLSQIGR